MLQILKTFGGIDGASNPRYVRVDPDIFKADIEAAKAIIETKGAGSIRFLDCRYEGVELLEYAEHGDEDAELIEGEWFVSL